uniref:Peptidase S1 domain-containing protein n=1 Tax=Heliothis virescens TaxID=7102 RepID=A0A2A4K582_HELVI
MAGFWGPVVLLWLAAQLHPGLCIYWDRLRCSSDSTQKMPEGTVADMGRFPWLGVVQHSFYVAGKTHFAVTGAVLIHPVFAIAAAEDISKIDPTQLTNNTKLILWGTNGKKYAIEVKDYILHPQFHERVTYATIALLDLISWGETSQWKAPVLPICMPIRGGGLFEDMYAVKLSDASGQITKESLKMKYVGNQDCEEFYYKAQLTYTKMNPVNPLCAVSEFSTKPCVWDGGTALITRQSWGFWKLLGFAVRGPGCGAPTRFLNMHDYLPWINDVISGMPTDETEDTQKFGMRRISPIKLIMYKASVKMPKGTGNCERRARGGVVYKDSSEFLVNKNFVQGFFFVVVTQLMEFHCAEITLDVSSRTNAAIWVEHSCHYHTMGLARGHFRPEREKMTCFLYYKTSAYIEFRFFFSFKAVIEVALFGKEPDAAHKRIPNPFKSSQHTTEWWPTPGGLRFWYWVPSGLWWYSL